MKVMIVKELMTGDVSPVAMFSLLARKAEMHSFPTMYIMGGRLVEMSQNRDFLKEVPKNSAFEGNNPGSPNFRGEQHPKFFKF